ncbi:DUF305 domain-containing protein [Streptomyces sp. NPDC054797]
MNTTPSRLRRRAALGTATAAVAALVLTACGDDGSSNATSAPPPAAASAPATVPAGEHNQADVAFAQGMIPHHRQAILMSEMVQSHGASDEVKALAAKIKKAQDPEIATMSGWLKAWGEKVPTGMDGMGGGDHDGSGMPGMMDNQRMDMLRGASGTAFDTMFLTMMIEHHKGAVEMAKTEKVEGAYGPAKRLADDIITAQTAEIAQMKTMLGKS